MPKYRQVFHDDPRWHSRGYLPHFDAGDDVAQFITFRLADSMPQTVLEEWCKQGYEDAEFRKKIEGYLDAGYGACWLTQDAIAKIVADALKFHQGKKYQLIAWVIMPNHVHVLLRVMNGANLSEILHSIKSFSALAANKVLARSGPFWQIESFDRYIRNGKHYKAVVRYIERNPVDAGLCGSPEEWRWSSAYKERSD